MYILLNLRYTEETMKNWKHLSQEGIFIIISLIVIFDFKSIYIYYFDKYKILILKRLQSVF